MIIKDQKFYIFQVKCNSLLVTDYYSLANQVFDTIINNNSNRGILFLFLLLNLHILFSIAYTIRG
jgi:ribose 5-phosphate isomerase RpiB